jgi:hypothetical protein
MDTEIRDRMGMMRMRTPQIALYSLILSTILLREGTEMMRRVFTVR